MKDETIFTKTKNSIKKLNIMILVLTGLFLSSSTMAINIAKTPLFLNQSASPNIMFILDDSGSMDWDILTVPHWKAQNYDHDVMRYWARGGWLGWSELPAAKVEDASWTSYTGYCGDRNADGICYNELYLNDDNDRNDAERTLIPADTSAPDWGLVLQHQYFWEFPYGYCQMPPTPPALPDAGDWLPSAEKVLAFLTGAKKANAHTGDFGPGSPHQWNGGNHPSAQNTDPAYREEGWKNTGPDLNTWTVNNGFKQNATAKTTCEGLGGTYKRNTSYNNRILHHAPNAHKPTWINGWSGAPTVDPLTKVITANGPLNSRTGDYHNEYFKNYSSATAGRARLDINGDGVGNDGSFREKDNQTNRVVNYRYIQHLTDNTYPQSNWLACGQTDDKKYYTAAKRCPRLNDSMPGNYPIASPNNPFENPSSKVASSIHNMGKLDFVQLSSPAVVPRYIRSTDWVGLPRSANVDVLMPPWAANTKHAMSKHDAFPLVIDWRVRSADFNVMYYSPGSKYNVWPGITEVLPSGCLNKFNCARSNPQVGTAGYNISPDLARPRLEYGAEGAAPVNVQAGFVYEVWVDDAGHLPSRTQPEWIRGDSHCGSTGGYTISAADVTASFGSAGVVDPATGMTYGALEHICFSYLNYNPDGSAGDGEIDLWDSHYRVEIKDTEIVVQKVRRTPHLKGEALYTDSVYNRSSHYYWDNNDSPVGINVGSGNYDFSSLDFANMQVAMSDTKVLATYNEAALRADAALCLKILGAETATPGVCRTLEEVKTNAANWYQYSRKRSFVAKGAIASLMAKVPEVNYGLMGTRKHNSNNVSQLFKDVFRDNFVDTGSSGNGNAVRTVHNDNIRDSLYSYVWPATGTPLRLALERAGEYFAGRGPNLGPGVNNHSISPITESCQKNFAVMLTDGYWNGDPPLAVGNVDGDPYTATLADVAKKYYDEDLAPSLDPNVPPSGFNTNTQQHLTTIGIGFGVAGSLKDDPDPSDSIFEDGWPGNPDASGASALTESSIWGGDPETNKPYKIDDLWHAAYNSRGLYLSASNPKELLDSLEAAIFFALQEGGSASALTSNGDFTTEGIRLYQTAFQSGVWTGDVFALERDTSTGEFSSVVWSAQDELTSVDHGDRNIFTLDVDASTGVRSGIPFRFASLSAPEQNAMRVRQITGVADLDGAKHVNYIRGDDANEDTLFRKRLGKKLGSIVHSSILRVDVPNGPYPDWTTGPEAGVPYSAFKALHNPTTTTGTTRPVMLFVGANDGMLHAFDELTGEEKYAYIPKMLIPKLNYLSHIPSSVHPFKHQFYVNDMPVVKDAFFGGAWHTTLVGGLRGGGKGIYALDITTVPNATVAESTIASDKYLWEFTDADDADLGFTFSRPQIARLANGKWVAIFGNGYQDDATGKAVLYIVDLADGSLIKKIVADGADIDNGLSSPTVVDIDDDHTADFVYAGDLKGNLWRFDLTDPDKNNWGVSLLFVAHETGNTLSTQPITVAPAVEIHTRGALAGLLVSFGTGKYIGYSDNNVAGEKTQTLYTIWDKHAGGTVDRGDLLEQQAVYQAAGAYGSRATSANPVTWMDSGHNIGESGWEAHTHHAGWYIDLTFEANNEGERQVNKALIFGPFITFDSLIPNSDACSGGGGSRRYIFDRESGANPDGAPVDTDSDGVISDAEAEGFVNAKYSQGYSYDEGNAQIPNDAGTFETYISKSGGGGGGGPNAGGIEVGILPDLSLGQRRSWIQLD